jgi:hypothetical protein
MGRVAERRFRIAAPVVFAAAGVLLAHASIREVKSAPPPRTYLETLEGANARHWLAENRQIQRRRSAMLKPLHQPHDQFVRHLVLTYGDAYAQASASFLDDVVATHWSALAPDEVAGGRRQVADALLVREMLKVTRRDGSTRTSIYVIQNHAGSTRRSRVEKQVGSSYVPLAELSERFAGGAGPADAITRVPELFLADLFADDPVYRLVDSRGRRRLAHTYGDCDEFEMAYVNLLLALDIPGEVFLPRVLTRKSHVRTRLRLEAGGVPVWLEVDNTHAGVRAVGSEPEAWSVPRTHYNVAWINDHAQAPLNLDVGRAARERIDARVRRVLGIEVESDS